MSKCARWVFTVPNYGDWRPRYHVQEMQYMVWQFEVCPTTGTPHIQGYVRFRGAKRMNTVRDYLSTVTAHLEPAKGTEAHNRDYCTKESSRQPGTQPTEHGTYDATKGRQGSRVDLDTVCNAIKTGTPLSQVALENSATYTKYHAGLEKLRQHYLSTTASAVRDVHTTVLWGPTGTGKSHRVRTAYPDAYIVYHGRDPFGNYQGQTVLIIEEFNYLFWEIDLMKQLLDKWPLQLDCRYTNKHALWTTVFILTNQDPRYWYPADAPASRTALLRRLTFPMGTSVEVTSQAQIVDLTWWTTPITPTPVLALPGDGAPPVDAVPTVPDTLLDFIDLT